MPTRSVDIESRRDRAAATFGATRAGYLSLAAGPGAPPTEVDACAGCHGHVGASLAFQGAEVVAYLG